jgi:D-aspartate ligase
MSSDTTTATPPGPATFDLGVRPAPVLVLRRSVGELQHCALGIARTLGRMGVPVYAVRRSRFEPATSSRYIVGGLSVRADTSEQEWIDQLMRLDPRLSGAILLPIDDVAAVAVGNHQERLSRRFRMCLQPPGVPRQLASKRTLAELCAEFDVPTPETVPALSYDDALQFAQRFGYPVVLKRDAAWNGVEGAQAASVLVVDGPEALRHGYERMRRESPHRPNVLVQEYIPGSSDTVWMFNGYFDRDANCRFAATGRKLRQCANGAGQTTLGICADNETVVDLASRLMAGVRYHGIVDMGFRYDFRDGRYKLLDVNPRVGSTFRLFAAPDGTDVVRAMYLDLTGAGVPTTDVLAGRTWIDEPHDVVAAARLARARDLSLRAWGQSTFRATETAWWAADDPIPFLGLMARLPVAGVAQAISGWRSEAGDAAGSRTDV